MSNQQRNGGVPQQPPGSAPDLGMSMPTINRGLKIMVSQSSLLSLS
jgi:hypothetical protein